MSQITINEKQFQELMVTLYGVAESLEDIRSNLDGRTILLNEALSGLVQKSSVKGSIDDGL